MMPAEFFGDARANTVTLTVTGDKMVNPGGWPSFPDGTTVVADLGARPEHGSFVAVRPARRQGLILRRFVVGESGARYLKTLNPRYETAELAAGDEIVGVVREFSARLK